MDANVNCMGTHPPQFLLCIVATVNEDFFVSLIVFHAVINLDICAYTEFGQSPQKYINTVNDVVRPYNTTVLGIRNLQRSRDPRPEALSPSDTEHSYYLKVKDIYWYNNQTNFDLFEGDKNNNDRRQGVPPFQLRYWGV